MREFVLKLRRLGYPIIACSICKTHLHALTPMSNNYKEMKSIVGKAKQKASHPVRELLPGTIWAEGGEFNRIRDKGHLRNSYDYIRTKQEPGTVVWSHRAEENWIDDPCVGVVVMGRNREHIRVSGYLRHGRLPLATQTPVSEVPRRPGCSIHLS